MGNSPGYDGSFDGIIDEVVIYNTVLSDTEISTHFAAAYGSTLLPSFTTQPKAVTNYVGLSATFSAAAIGSLPLIYQWQKNGVDITGANGSTFTTPTLTTGSAGLYRCLVSNSVGSTNSAAVALTVLPTPTSTVTIPGLVLHHTFDNTLIDATGRGNNGTAIARDHTSASNVVGATYTSGKLGRALAYASDFGTPTEPGATTVTNTSYVTLGVRPDLQFSNSVSFSVAFWIKLPANFIGGDLPFFTSTSGSLGGAGWVLLQPTDMALVVARPQRKHLSTTVAGPFPCTATREQEPASMERSEALTTESGITSSTSWIESPRSPFIRTVSWRGPTKSQAPQLQPPQTLTPVCPQPLAKTQQGSIKKPGPERWMILECGAAR